MTNEQLAGLIKSGNNDELIPILWERVNKLLFLKADRFYNLNTGLCSRKGVERSDIRQECYCAFLEALKGYKPSEKLKFTTFLDYPFKNAVNQLLGLRTQSGINEPLNNCKSLDKPLKSSESEDFTLSDIIADESSLDFIAALDADEEAKEIRKAVDELPEQQRRVIKGVYFENKTLRQIAESLNISYQSAGYHKEKAIRALRRNPTLIKIEKEHNRNFVPPSAPFYLTPEQIIDRLSGCGWHRR